MEMKEGKRRKENKGSYINTFIRRMGVLWVDREELSYKMTFEQRHEECG